MKSCRCWVYPLVIIVGLCAAQPAPETKAQTLNASQPVSDSAAAIKENPPEETLTPDSSHLALELVPSSMFDRGVAMLAAQGVDIPKCQILAMGFEPSTPGSGIKILVLIAFDVSGQPRKYMYETSSDVYSALMGAATVGKQRLEPASDVKETPSVAPVAFRQDGRVYFMLTSAFKSMWVYPANIANAFDGIDGRVVAGLSLLTLGGSLYGSYLFTKNKELGYGRVEFMNYGGDLGGLTYPNLMGAFLANTANADNSATRQFIAWTGIFGFPAGIYAGSKVRFAGNFQYGNASIMTTMSKFGFLYGFLLPLYGVNTYDEKAYVSWATGLTMALIPTGFYVGYKLVGDKDYSSGRSVFITTTGVMGALTGAFIPTLFESDMFESKDKELIATTTIAGHILGTYLGFNYRSDQSYTFGQGLFMAASAIIGTGVADALPLIAKVENHNAYTLWGIGGAWGGLWLGEVMARSLFEKSPQDKRLGSSISFPGLGELAFMLARQKLQTHPASPRNGDFPEIVEKVTLMNVQF